MSDDTLFDTSVYTVVPRQPIADYGNDVDYDPYWAATSWKSGVSDRESGVRSQGSVEGRDVDNSSLGEATEFLGEFLSPTQDPNSPRNSSTSNDLSVVEPKNENSPRKSSLAKFLGEFLSPTQDPNSPRNSSTSNELGLTSVNENPPRKSSLAKFLGESDQEENSPRKNQRKFGDGSGYIYIRTVTKKGREYHEAYYHYEFWLNGKCAIKSTKYISKRLLKQIEQMEAEKVPVTEILNVLGVIYW